jgi:hypothetical protein
LIFSALKEFSFEEKNMHYKKTAFLFLFAGMALVLAAGTFLMTATPVKAQCGSQASSCKNCHEVQGQDSVNADGTGWHQSHAFGDFCYICHAGNNQATDKAAAHEGMVAPLADINAACQQCHVADLAERAQVYATALGVEIGSGSAAPATGGEAAAAPASADATSGNVPGPGCGGIVVDDPNAVNYAQNYDAIVLGKKPINWGNAILIGMISLMVVGGGGFVITREKLVKLSFGDTHKVEGEYPADVLEMLPQIAGLKSKTRKSLKDILDRPAKADRILELMDSVITEKTEEE